MDEDRELIGDLDCPSLLCEELGDFDNGDNDQGRRSREGGGEEEESLSQDEEGGQEQEQEENGEEEGGNKVSSVLEENLIEIGGEEEEWEKPTSGPKAGEPQEGQMEDKIENDEGTISDKQEDKETNGLEEKDVQKKSRKRRGKKQSERARSKRSVKDVSERVEGEKKSQMQELPEMSPEEGLSLPEPPVGLMNSCDLSDSVYLSCGGAGLYCPPVPIPLLYSAQRQVPIQPAPPQPHGTKRLHSPPLPHPLPQPAPQPLEMEITQVYSTRRSIRYSTRGRGRTLEFPLLPGLEPVDSCLLPPAPKKKTRTLYSTDQLEHLEGLFQEDHYPDAEKRRIIAATVGVTPQRIMVWFQNRRAKWRKAERSVTGKGEHRPSRTGLSSSPHQTNPALPAQAAPTSKGAGSLTGHVGPKPPPPLRPAAPPLHTQTLPSYSTLLACITSPCQSRARDGVQHQPSSQGGAAEYQPPPMHSPPPLRRASLSLFTPNYNPVNPTSNPTPPFLNTPSHTPPLFLDALEGSSSLSHRDTQSLQTDTSSLFDYGERLEYLTSSQQNNTLSYQLQTSYPPSQPQTQASLPRLAYLTPSPYLTPNPPDSNPTSYLTFGPGGGSTGVVTYAAAGGHAYYQSQSAGQILLQSTGHHGGITAYQSYPWGNMYSQPTMLQRAQCPPAYSGGGLGAARDHQTPSTTPLAGPPFFSRASYGLSHADVQHSSHTQAHTTTTTTSSSSSTAVLPPVSTLRPSRLRAESAAPSQVIAASPESPPAPSCVKIEYDSPGEIHSHFHCDFSPIHF